MSRRKLERVIEIDKAIARAAALSSIDPALDLGNGLTLTAYQMQIENFRIKHAAYNTLLSQVDASYNECLAQLEVVKAFSERMLTGVAFKYTKDSNEYEMAGGTRKSERKKPVRKPKNS
ncbi:hypothetical protein ACTHGU_01835 [Chitinophagaceae bacterium MMS25-I14]